MLNGTLDLRNKQVCGLNVGRGLFTGEILLDGAKVRGPFQLQGGERVEGRVSANRAEFFQRAAFYGTSFENGVEFSAAKFDQDADFLDVEITGEDSLVANHTATFHKAQFFGPLTFMRTHFNADANFDGCTFARDVSWDGVRFDGDTSFNDAVFRDSVSFRDVGIVSGLLFTHNQFPGLTLFDGLHRIPDPDARFKSGPPSGLDESALVMHGVHFLGPASFDGVHVRRLLFPMNLSPTR